MSTSAAPDPSVFTLESLSMGDGRSKRRTGHQLHDSLYLAQKAAEYRYIRTKQELAAMLQQFHDSRKRYSHISCHGSDRVWKNGLPMTAF